MLVTIDVLKLDRFNEVNVQYSNILLILVTFDVSKLDKSKVYKEVQ